jgi:hypothetical protein
LYVSLVRSEIPYMTKNIQEQEPTTKSSRPSYIAADFTRAARRCAELAVAHPSWPQARVRRVVSWEMEIRSSTLRYLLRQAGGRCKDGKAPLGGAVRLYVPL